LMKHHTFPRELLYRFTYIYFHSGLKIKRIFERENVLVFSYIILHFMPGNCKIL
jgi:hypothetical protein